MRYPLFAFLIVFIIPPFTAHALLTGKANIANRSDSAFSAITVASSEPAQTFNWTLPTPNRAY